MGAEFMNSSANSKINIAINKSMLHFLCGTKTLNFSVWDDRLTPDHRLLSLSVFQNGTDTVYDFSNDPSPSGILETLLYLDMYFMQDNDEAKLTFCREVTL